MMRVTTVLVCGSFAALACTCVRTDANFTIQTDVKEASLVFRGSVVSKKTLPQRPDLNRGRYEIVFQILESWKGTDESEIRMYVMDDGTDCLGGANHQIGKTYLVFAQASKSKDVYLENRLWYGWADIIPRETPMFIPVACTSSGEVSEKFVRQALAQLGPGRIPSSR